MTRQLELKREVREAARRDALVRALDYGLPGALAHQGATMLGFALKYGEFVQLLTLKASFEGKAMVCFVSSDTIMNCFLRAESLALGNNLDWRPDKYAKK